MKIKHVINFYQHSFTLSKFAHEDKGIHKQNNLLRKVIFISFQRSRVLFYNTTQSYPVI